MKNLNAGQIYEHIIQQSETQGIVHPFCQH